MEVCCEKQEGKPIKILPSNVPEYQPKCGQHHSEGLDVKGKNPSDGNLSTTEGEWPHTCILFDKSKNIPENFIGGGSLIASGIVLTAAHKVL